MKAFFDATWRLFLLVLIGLGPFLALAGFFGWHDAIKVSLYGFFVAFMATLPNGTRTGVSFALIFAAIAGLGAMLQHSVIGLTLLIAATAALIPIGGYLGHLQAGLFATMFAPNTVNPAPSPWVGESSVSLWFFLAIAGVTLLGGLWGLLIGTRLRKVMPEKDPPGRLSGRLAVLGGAVIVLTAGLVTYVSVTNFPTAKWAWLIAAVVSMMMATAGVTWRTSFEMIFGTLAGVGIAVAFLFARMPTSLMVIVGTLLICLSVALKMGGKPFWVSTGISTSGVVFVTGSSMDPFLAAEDRLLFTAVGSVLAVLVGVVLTWISRAIDADDGVPATTAANA